ncbi:hypothetical protein CONLIGDRAFT_694138 [Coniochaeta ligniaria NRRL 30616]|uniref:Uncharacterized protein n=1 Tax=Coniochaeta ligniaria NRRL 30616 TaxID=1408157 RepID=A0A1J7J1Y9_9PEZI|nr:hypothetical protein CONLIGDRAFT_694138 [Coniochaeta ligniaria NRRL 30616]
MLPLSESGGCRAAASSHAAVEYQASLRIHLQLPVAGRFSADNNDRHLTLKAAVESIKGFRETEQTHRSACGLGVRKQARQASGSAISYNVFVTAGQTALDSQNPACSNCQSSSKPGLKTTQAKANNKVYVEVISDGISYPRTDKDGGGRRESPRSESTQREPRGHTGTRIARSNLSSPTYWNCSQHTANGGVSALGEPIVDLGASADGRWVLATLVFSTFRIPSPISRQLPTTNHQVVEFRPDFKFELLPLHWPLLRPHSKMEDPVNNQRLDTKQPQGVGHTSHPIQATLQVHEAPDTASSSGDSNNTNPF